MSIAAQARAAKIAAAEEAAVKAAAARAPKPRKAIQPNFAPEPATTTVSRRNVSPAARRKAFLIASTAGGVLAASGVDLALQGANDDGAPGAELEGEAAKILMQMQEDRRRLKEIQSIERKVEFKLGLLPAYEGWCNGVIAAGKSDRIGLLDDLFTTVMAWRIDVGDYAEALRMAEHCFRYSLKMPERFKRGTAAFVVEQISEAAIKAYDAGGDDAKAFPAAVLPMLQDLVDTYDEDLHDEISAKLQRAIGLAIMAGADLENEDDLRARREQTLRCYLRALKLNPRVGVKKQVEQLQRQLRGVASAADAVASAAEHNGDDAGGTDQAANDQAEPTVEGAADTEQNPSAPEGDD